MAKAATATKTAAANAPAATLNPNSGVNAPGAAAPAPDAAMNAGAATAPAGDAGVAGDPPVAAEPGPAPLEADVLESGDIGAPYSEQAIPPSLREGRAMPPFQFSMWKGQLPHGLRLQPGGLIEGTPMIAGDYEFGVQAHDANNVEHQGLFSITVTGPAPADETAAS